MRAAVLAGSCRTLALARMLGLLAALRTTPCFAGVGGLLAGAVGGRLSEMLGAEPTAARVSEPLDDLVGEREIPDRAAAAAGFAGDAALGRTDAFDGDDASLGAADLARCDGELRSMVDVVPERTMRELLALDEGFIWALAGLRPA